MLDGEVMLDRESRVQEDVRYHNAVALRAKEDSRREDVLMKGDPNAKWYQFSMSMACPLPIPDHPTTRNITVGILAVGTAAALWWGSAHLPSVDARATGSPVSSLKK